MHTNPDSTLHFHISKCRKKDSKQEPEKDKIWKKNNDKIREKKHTHTHTPGSKDYEMTGIKKE